MLRLLGSGLIVVSTLLALEWVIAYHRLTGGQWRHNEMGRHLMAFEGALAAVLTLSSIRIVTDLFGYPDPAWFQALRLIVFVSIPVVFVWRRWLLAKAQQPAPV